MLVSRSRLFSKRRFKSTLGYSLIIHMQKYYNVSLELHMSRDYCWIIVGPIYLYFNSHLWKVGFGAQWDIEW